MGGTSVREALDAAQLRRPVLACLLAVLLTGCALVSMNKEVTTLSNEATVLQGEVSAEGWGGRPIVVVLSREAEAGRLHRVDFRLLYAPGSFLFVVREGSFQLAAFEDRDGDLAYEPGDPAAVWGEPSDFTLKGNEERTGFDLGPLSPRVRLGERFDISGESGATRLTLLQENLGAVVSLDDRRLSSEMGAKGLWKPREYLLEVGAGIFFLEPYDPDKIPVLFVHGIAGSPSQFRYLIDSLDPERYQPWLFAYPSSFPLAYVGRVLNEMLKILHQRHDFERLDVVAHSMGGLVARAFINEYILEGHHHYLRHFVTLSTPWNGADVATYYRKPPSALEVMGLTSRPLERLSVTPGEAPQPLAVPGTAQPADFDKPHISWVDMEPGSEFLRNLLVLPLPEEADFCMAWGWEGGAPLAGDPGDGVIALWSLLRSDAQEQARDQYGGAWSHAGILESEAAIGRVMEWLDRDSRHT
jgi:pimeloyl-ACP methyl ester carboxylesterase